MADIRLEDIAKRYENGFEAVQKANLHIQNGEFLVLVGPSGCGKSTTLRMIAGLEEITEGKLFIGDRLVNDVEPGQRDIAMVFQNYALYPHMTVRQNMSFGLRMRKEAKATIDQRVKEAANILSIENLLDRKPRELSGGQRQRVAVGRAIVRKPQAFLFDEPLSNLDAKLRVQMRTELARLHQKLQTTTVYVTHDQVEAMTLGDRIVVMKDGRIQQIDTPLNLYNHPCNRFVASFIGSPAMNFVKGTVVGSRFKTENMDVELSLSNENSGQLENHACHFGFRPEEVTTEKTNLKLFDGTVEVVERMGHETIVYTSIDSFSVVVRVQGDSKVQTGTRTSFYLTPDAWHLFKDDGDQPLVACGIPKKMASSF